MTIKLISTNDETLVFEVSSSSRDTSHDIYINIYNGWVCTCEQYYYRKLECKHMREVQEYLQMVRDYTIVGIGYDNVLELSADVIDQLVSMGTYNEIQNWEG